MITCSTHRRCWRFLDAEPGADRVSDALLNRRAIVLAVNLTKVLSRLLDWKIPLDTAVTRLDAFDFRKEPYTRSGARRSSAAH